GARDRRGRDHGAHRHRDLRRPQAGKGRGMKIAFIGGGNMATALAGGLIKRGQAPSSIQVVEPDPAQRKRIGKLRVRVFAASDDKSLSGAQAIVIAVKPQQMRETARALASLVKGRLVVSVAAGIRLADLSRWLGGQR